MIAKHGYFSKLPSFKDIRDGLVRQWSAELWSFTKVVHSPEELNMIAKHGYFSKLSPFKGIRDGLVRQLYTLLAYFILCTLSRQGIRLHGVRPQGNWLNAKKDSTSTESTQSLCKLLNFFSIGRVSIISRWLSGWNRVSLRVASVDGEWDPTSTESSLNDQNCEYLSEFNIKIEFSRGLFFSL
jgi:hypothetical protein